MCSFICGFLLCLLLPFFSPLPFSFSGEVDENQACFIFSSECAEYFSFVFSLFLCAPSFFFPQSALMCLWIRYHSIWMSSQTRMHAHAHTDASSFYTRDQNRPHTSMRSCLFVTLCHVLLHPHHSPYGS